MPNYYVKSARELLAMTTASYSRNKIVERRAPHTQRTWKISMRSHSAGKPPGSRQGSLGKRFMWNIWGRPTSQSLSRLPKKWKGPPLGFAHPGCPSPGGSATPHRITRFQAQVTQRGLRTWLPRLIPSSSGSPRQPWATFSVSLSFPRPEADRSVGAMFAGH